MNISNIAYKKYYFLIIVTATCHNTSFIIFESHFIYNFMGIYYSFISNFSNDDLTVEKIADFQL